MSRRVFVKPIARRTLAQFGLQLLEANKSMLDFKFVRREGGLVLRLSGRVQIFDIPTSIGNELRKPLGVT